MKSQRSKEFQPSTTLPKNPSEIESLVVRCIHSIKDSDLEPEEYVEVCCEGCCKSEEISVSSLHQFRMSLEFIGTKERLEEFIRSHIAHREKIVARSSGEVWSLSLQDNKEKVEPTTINTDEEAGSNPPIQSLSFDPTSSYLAEPDAYIQEGGLIEVSSGEELDLLIERLNHKYFYVVIGTNGYVGYFDYDHVLNRQVISYLTPSTFHELHAATRVIRPYLCDDDKEPMPERLTKIWMGYPGWRHYKAVVFSPDRPVPQSKLNLWQDFRQNAKAGDCRPFLDFIFEVISNSNSSYYKYILTWMADSIQNISADNKPGVALVLRGERGTGKSFFATQFGAIFKQYFIHIIKPDYLVGKFNRHLLDCIFLFADEVPGSKLPMRVIQGFITEPTNMIEIKGKDAFIAPNYIRVMLASNFEWVVPAGEKERRWAVFDVSSCHIQDTPYFGKLDRFTKDGGRDALLHYLLNYDCSRIDLRKIPRTSALTDQLISTMGSIYSYWFSLLQRGSYPSATSLQNEVKWGATLMMKEEVYKDYLQTVTTKPERKSSTAFWIRVRNLCHSLKEVPLSTTEYKRAFEVPPLKEARNLFDKCYGHNFS